jgi:GAF domain-containing protein
METITIVAELKKEKYKELFPQIVSLVADERDIIANLANVSAALKVTFPSFSWIGFYRLMENELVLGPFQGKVACVRIKIGSGVCGIAAKERKTIIVPDVTEFPGHIVCDPEAKSEIVVPLVYGEDLFGVMDVDSNEIDSFNDEDRINLEKIAGIIARKFIQR